MDIGKTKVGVPVGEAPVARPAGEVSAPVVGHEGAIDYKTEALKLRRVITSTCERLAPSEESEALASRVRSFGHIGAAAKDMATRFAATSVLEDAASCGGDTGGVRRAGYEGLKRMEPKIEPSPLIVSGSLYLVPSD